MQNCLQYNFNKILSNKKITLQQFCTQAKININEYNYFLEKSIISLDHPIVIKMCNILNCKVSDLFKQLSKKAISQLKNSVTVQDKNLLPSFNDIDIELFSESIAKVDNIINREGKIIPPLQKAKAYMIFYELASKMIDNS